MSRGMVFLLYAGFGLAPLWVSTFVVISGSRGASSEYWNAAPWLIVFAIPVCGITLIIAAITHAIANRMSSATPATAVILAGLALSVAVVWKVESREYANKTSPAEEQRLAERFVEAHPDVVRITDGISTAHVTGTSTRWGKVVQYHAETFRYPTKVMITVAVTRSDGVPRFKLTCMVTDAEISKLGRNPCGE